MTAERRTEAAKFAEEFGCNVTWDLNIDLGPGPGGNKLSSDEQRRIWWDFDVLQFTLMHVGRSLTLDQSSKPLTSENDEKIDVAVLAPPDDCIGLLLEGARQVPGAFHLVLSSSWLTVTPADNGLHDVFLAKAITFGLNGLSCVNVFTPPRRVTYLLQSCRKDRPGLNTIPKNLSCPHNIVNKPFGEDRAAAHNILEKAHVNFPSALMFDFQFKELPAGSDPRFSVHHLKKPIDESQVKRNIEEFLNQSSMQGVEQVIIHPVHRTNLGPQDTCDVQGLAARVIDLLQSTGEDEYIIVEPFIQCLRPFKPAHDDATDEVQWTADESIHFLVKTLVCRDFNNKPVASSIVCLVMKHGSAPSRSIDQVLCQFDEHQSAVQSLSSTLKEFRVTDEQTRIKVEEEIRRQSEAILQAIVDSGNNSAGSPESLTQTDFVGVDFIVDYNAGELCPNVVKITTHPEFAAFQRFELTNMAFPSIQIPALPNARQRAFQPLVANMASRSQAYALRGKRVLVIAAGWQNKKDLWPPTFMAGIKAVVVDSNPNHPIKDQVDRFIYYDFEDRKREEEHAENIARIVRELGLKLDGCFTFWEPSVELHAMICQKLGLKGNSVIAAQNAKEKSRTKNALLKLRTRSVLLQNVRDYVTPAYLINSSSDVDIACRELKFPAIIKTETGAASLGCTKVRTPEELREALPHVTQTVHDNPIIAFGFGDSVVVEEFHEGSKHVVDLAIFNGELVVAIVSDSGLVNPPFFTVTAGLIPSALPGDKRAQVIVAAFQCCTGIGLNDGMFNVDLIMTSAGPKLVEINARMGGYCLRHWIKGLYHQDILLLSYMISCGIRPFMPQVTPSEYIISAMLSPTHHKKLLTDPERKKRLQDLHESGAISFVVFDPNLVDVWGEYEIPCANVAVAAPSVAEAKQRLLAICHEHDIETPEYKVSNFVKYF